MGTLCGFDSNRRGVVENDALGARQARQTRLRPAFSFHFFLTKPRLAMVVLAS